MNQPIYSTRALIAFASLIFASMICVGLVIARWLYTDAPDFKFMIWNLFLAWIPFVMAFAAYGLHHLQGRWGVAVFGCAVVWLLFLPNAPYMLTDLVHLRHRADSLVWLDLMLLLWFAWTGFMLGFSSLYLMQQIVSDRFGQWISWVFAISSIGLTSFGIYLGRFLRWNSWDVLHNPTALFADIYYRFRHPIANYQAHLFWLLLALFLISLYVTFTMLPTLRQKQQTP